MLILEYISTHGNPEWHGARISARESTGRLPAYEQLCTSCTGVCWLYVWLDSFQKNRVEVRLNRSGGGEVYSSLSGPTDCISCYVRTYLGTFSLAFYGTCVESGPTQFYVGNRYKLTICEGGIR